MSTNFKYTILSFAFIGLLFSSCNLLQSFKKGSSIDKRLECSALNEVTNNEFSELSSDMYQLNEVEQVNDRLLVSISSNLNIEVKELYWNGFVRGGELPEASVKIIVTGTPSESKEKTSQLCFDISNMQKHGEQIKLYFMDDEEVFVLDFIDTTAAMK